MRVILASQSPRRKELLGHIYNEFDICVSKAEEPSYSGGEIYEYVENLAEIKARAVFDKQKTIIENWNEDTIIIGADTIVVQDGTIFGKPTDRADACRMMNRLSGAVHQVYTGVCIILITADGSVLSEKFHETTDVHFDLLTDEEIEAYLSTKEPYDKAGAYGIQGIFSKHILKINGDYFNVVGLPVNRLYREINNITKH